MFNIKMREFDKCNSFLVYSSFTICSFCGGKPCPDHGSIGHHWWSSGQDLCFRCRGSLSGEVRTPVGAEVGVTLTILQSGDPDVLFTNHTCCKDYGTRLSHTALAHLR